MEGPLPRAASLRRAACRAALAALISLALTTAATTPGAAETGGPGACRGTTVRGVELRHGEGQQFIRLGRALAQVFDAPDSLVHTMTVWLPANRIALNTPLHLFILRVDRDGRPIADPPVADGGSLDLGERDGTDAARYTFTFAPPAILPSAGRYALALVPDRCTVIPVLADDGADFADGELWELNQRHCGGPLTSLAGRVDGFALSFRVEFCEGGTMTSGHTWGELKTLYR